MAVKDVQDFLFDFAARQDIGPLLLLPLPFEELQHLGNRSLEVVLNHCFLLVRVWQVAGRLFDSREQTARCSTAWSPW